MPRIVLCTGGNLGDVAATLAAARYKLTLALGNETAASSVMESEAWGFSAPEKFLNQVLVLETRLSPEAALDRCQQIENEMGRTRSPGKGYMSRTLDIDILFYGDEIIDTPRLKIPHPLIAQRAFVLDPLAEVLPRLVHPVLGKTVSRLLRELKRKEKETDRNERRPCGQ